MANRYFFDSLILLLSRALFFELIIVYEILFFVEKIFNFFYGDTAVSNFTTVRWLMGVFFIYFLHETKFVEFSGSGAHPFEISNCLGNYYYYYFFIYEMYCFYLYCFNRVTAVLGFTPVHWLGQSSLRFFARIHQPTSFLRTEHCFFVCFLINNCL